MKRLYYSTPVVLSTLTGYLSGYTCMYVCMLWMSRSRLSVAYHRLDFVEQFWLHVRHYDLHLFFHFCSRILYRLRSWWLYINPLCNPCTYTYMRLSRYMLDNVCFPKALSYFCHYHCYAPTQGGIKRWCCLTSVCLTSVAYIRSVDGICVLLSLSLLCPRPGGH